MDGLRTFSRRRFTVLAFAVLLALAGSPLFAGFPSTEVFLPAVGRLPGLFGAQFYTTIWATNLTGSTVSFTFEFLKQGQANTNPASFSDTLAPGETKTYENVVETKLGLTDALGGARVTSSGEILVAERIYNQEPGDDLGKTEGLFFAGVPKSFAISLGQSASIQGIDQGGSENFRYNFALVETAGGSPTVHVVLYDGSGAALGSTDYSLHPYEQIQPNVEDLVKNLATTNARITATVTAGTGSVLLAGAQVANDSQDSSGFEMSFRDDLLGGGGGGGLSAVVHDGTLVGNGTVSTPLGVNPAAIVTSLNGLHGAVTLSAGSNVTLTPSGQTLTIAASGGGGGGGLTLPFSGSASVPAGAAFNVQNPGTDGVALQGTGTGAGVYGQSTSGNGIIGTSSSSWGVHGVSSGTGVNGAAMRAEGNGIGLFATNTGSDATVVATNATSGVIYKGFANGGTLVFQVDATGVQGSSATTGQAGIHGTYSGSGQGYGILGDTNSIFATAVYGNNPSGTAIWGHAGSFNYPSVIGENTGGGLGLYSKGDAQVDGDLTVYGNFQVAGGGTKSFVSPDPTDAGRQIVYACLEGPESGTYFRGSGRIAGGFASIEVPEDFRLVTKANGLTVIATPVGAPAVLTVMKKGLDRIVIQGSADVEFDYMVNGVRAEIPNHPAIQPNKLFIPRSASDDMTRRMSAGTIRFLKRNGVLNADGSVNLETAHRLGWDRQPGWSASSEEDR